MILNIRKMLLNVLKTLRRLRQFLSGSFVFRIFAVTNLYLYGRGKAFRVP